MMEPGRPPIFETPEAMQEMILEYFEWVKGELNPTEEMHEKGAYKRQPENVTITGLCLHLGFESRQSFYDYEGRDGFSYTIKRARMRVENSYENKLLDAKNPTGPIFALKNMGWSDKQEVTQETTIKDDRIDASKLTPEQRDQLAAIQLQLRRGESQESV